MIANSLYIISPSSLSQEIYSPYFVYFGQRPPYNISGQVIFADPPLACDEESLVNGAEMNGKIVFVDFGTRLFFIILHPNSIFVVISGY